MLSGIRLANFKAAKDVSLRLSQLTLLTGLNSSGKSTVLQSIALLKQSDLPVSTAIRLLGSLVQVGSYADLRTHGSDSDTTTIDIDDNGHNYKWTFGAGVTQHQIKIIEAPESLPDFLFGDQFLFLQADRIVPNNVYPRSIDGLHTSGFLGSRGEYVAEYLASADERRESVSEKRVCRNNGLNIARELFEKAAPTTGVLDQVAGWLQQLSPGVRVSVDELLGTDSFRLRYDYVGRSGVYETDEKIRPGNVGFGLTYSLPIVVACLAAKPGSLLLLENPEAHLHPQGQAALGRLIVGAATDGVQVILETHSDHVLNAIRLSVKEQILDASQLVIHFFARDVETGFADVQSPAVRGDGSLSDWPSGFFDQWDRALDQLLAE